MKKTYKAIIDSIVWITTLSILIMLSSCAINTESKSNDIDKVSGKLNISIIDVGQGDCILLQQGNENMLIDAGPNESENRVKDYMKLHNIEKFDYVIGTHSHEDHIGSLDYIINSFNIGEVYFTKQLSTTKCFENFIDACSNKNLKLNAPEVGDTFKLGQAVCTIISPKKEAYENVNDSSIVIKVTFGSTSFIFTGDAGKEAEEEMLNSDIDLKADFLKIGHHGSKSATTDKFINAVNPKYAVISVGKNNDYKLPSKKIMDRLKRKNVEVYRTDESGTIEAASDGTSITFENDKGSYEEGKSNSRVIANYEFESEDAEDKDGTQINNSTDDERIVYWTEKGKSYHYDKNCSTLKKSKDIKSGKKKECPKDDECNVCIK